MKLPLAQAEGGGTDSIGRLHQAHHSSGMVQFDFAFGNILVELCEIDNRSYICRLYRGHHEQIFAKVCLCFILRLHPYGIFFRNVHVFTFVLKISSRSADANLVRFMSLILIYCGLLTP